MKVLIQRVTRAAVTIKGHAEVAIGRGFAVLLGVAISDTPDDARKLANRTADLRIFPDDQEKMNRSLIDIDGEALVVSQFTLQADTRKGNRPSFINAAPPEQAKPLYELYVASLRERLGANRVKTGVFRASMVVEILNDGPVTIELSS